MGKMCEKNHRISLRIVTFSKLTFRAKLAIIGTCFRFFCVRICTRQLFYVKGKVMTTGITAASDRATEAAEKLPPVHPVWLLWKSPNKEKAWDAFYKKCGNSELDPNSDAAKIAFYDAFASMCERFAAGGVAARTEEMYLRELLDEALKTFSPIDHLPSSEPRGSVSLRTSGLSVAEVLAQPFDPAYRPRRGFGEEGFGS